MALSCPAFCLLPRTTSTARCVPAAPLLLAELGRAGGAPPVLCAVSDGNQDTSACEMKGREGRENGAAKEAPVFTVDGDSGLVCRR
eukprot:COSAG06_NODE_5666_length_3333_cov_35.317873_2_plen_86_part_00